MKLENIIYCGDNLTWMRKMPEGFVNLIYIDPPFFSNRKYEVIFNDGEEIRSFQDRWKGGIEHYIEWMRDRVFEAWRILRDTGSFYLHCDYHASHHLRIMLDEIFGPNQFQNEIIWYYRGGGVSHRRFGRRHDTIFFYTKGKKWTFNSDPIRERYSEETLERTEYTARAFRGKRVYDKWKPHPIGKHPDDVWIMQPIMPSSKERLSYPTQKPLRLLDRIIKGSSNPEDLVFDPFCGCGTTLVAAHRLKRKWLGIDVSPTACKLMKRRLSREAATKVEIVGLPLEISELRSLNYVEFQNWVIGSLGGTVSDKPSRDMGIDGYSYMVREPIQVKQQENVGRPELDKFQSAIRRKKKRKGVLVGFSFTKGTYEEAARLKHDDGIEIELMNVDDVRRALEST